MRKFLILTLSAWSVWTSAMKPPVRVMTGAYVKQIRDVVLYDSTAPQFYRLNFPSTHLFHLNEAYVGSCEHLHTPSCKAIKMIEKLNSHWKQNINDIASSLSMTTSHQYAGLLPLSVPAKKQMSSGRRRRSIFSAVLGDALDYCCDVVTKQDISDIESNTESATEFMRIVKNSVIQEHQYLIQVNNNTQRLHNELKNAVHQFQSVFYDVTQLQDQINANFSGEIRVVKLEAFRDLMVALHTSQLSFWTSHIIRLNSIVQTCNAGFIPVIAITKETLLTDLKSLEQKLKNHGYQLAIPLDQIGKYYRLQIATCFSSENQLNIRVTIPVTQNVDRKLYEIKKVPFSWHKTTCHVRLEPTLVAVRENEVSVISGTDLQQCIPATGLCRLPQLQSDLLHGSACPRLLFAGTTIEKLNSVCLLECTPTTEMAIVQIDFHTFVVANLPEGSLIQCANESISVPTTPKGALEIMLPCHCRLSIPSNSPLRPPFPCPMTLGNFSEVTHILPAAWSPPSSQIVSIQQQQNTPTYTNLSEVLNENWTYQLPAVNLTIPEHILLEQKRLPKLIKRTSYLLPSFSFVWSLVLTIAVAWLFFQQYRHLPILSSLSAMFSLLPFAGVKADGTALETIHYTEIVLIVIFSINFVLIMVFVAVIVYQLCCRPANGLLPLREIFGSDYQTAYRGVNEESDLEMVASRR